MRTDLQCALNGVNMTSLDSNLYIQDIEETVKVVAETNSRAYRGVFLAREPYRESVTITVKFMLKQCDRELRQAAIQAVNAWARDGWLTISTRPGQRIYASCTQPVNYRIFSWSDELSVVFTAYDDAVWQEATPVTQTSSGSDISIVIKPNGTRPCKLEVKATNNSGSEIDNVSIAVNNRAMTFEDLGLANTKLFRISYDDHGLLKIVAGSGNRLNRRTADSADDLWLNPGVNNTVAFVADGVCSVELSARGLYD